MRTLLFTKVVVRVANGMLAHGCFSFSH